MLEEQILLEKQLEQLAGLLKQGDVHRAFLLIKTIEKQLSSLTQKQKANKKLVLVSSNMREYQEQYQQLSSVSSYLYSIHAEIGRVSATAQLLRQGIILFFAGLMLLGFDFDVTPMLGELIIAAVMTCAIALCQRVSERYTAKITTAVSLGIISYSVYQNQLTSGLEMLSIVAMMGWERWAGAPLPLVAKAILVALQRHFILPVPNSSTQLEPNDSSAILVSSRASISESPNKLTIFADWDHTNATWQRKMFQGIMETCEDCTLILEGECSRVQRPSALSMYYNCIVPERYSTSSDPTSCFFIAPSRDIRVRGMDSSFSRYQPENPSVEHYLFLGDVTKCIGTVAFQNREEYNVKVNDFVSLANELFDLVTRTEHLCREFTGTSVCALTAEAISSARREIKTRDSDYIGRIVNIMEDIYQKGALPSLQKMIDAGIEGHSKRFDFFYLKKAIIERVEKIGSMYNEIITLLKDEGDKAAIKAIQSTKPSLSGGSSFFRIGAAHLAEGRLLSQYLEKLQRKIPVVLRNVDTNEEIPFKPFHL